MHDAKRKNPSLKGYTLYDPVYRTFRQRQHCRNGEQISGDRVGGGFDYERATCVGNFLSDEIAFYPNLCIC